MYSFKLKMRLNRFRAGLCLGPRWGTYDTPPDSLIGCGRRHPSPYLCPLDAFGVLITASFLAPPIQIPGFM